MRSNLRQHKTNLRRNSEEGKSCFPLIELSLGQQRCGKVGKMDGIGIRLRFQAEAGKGLIAFAVLSCQAAIQIVPLYTCTPGWSLSTRMVRRPSEDVTSATGPKAPCAFDST